MSKIARVGFPVAFAASVIATFVFFSVPGMLAFSWLIGGYGVALLCAVFHPGDKSRLQYMFLSIGAMLATAAIAFSWGWGGWVGVGVCAFLVLTMKIDGGDSYGG
jgi:hypothetical protein